MDAARLAQDNMGLVYAAANRFPWADRSEMVQSGCVGLMEAACRFDAARGVQFSTYAVPYILGEMRAFLRRDHAVHIPRTIQALSSKAYQMAQTLRDELDREPTLGEIAARLSITPAELAAAIESGLAPMSLDAPMDDEPDSSSFGDMIGDTSQQAEFDRVVTQDFLSRRSQVERALVQLRFYRGMTQERTAKALGMSQSQVCRVEKRLFEDFRKQETV